MFPDPVFHFYTQRAILAYKYALLEQVEDQGVISPEGYFDLPQFQVLIYPNTSSKGNSAKFKEIEHLSLNQDLIRSQLDQFSIILHTAKLRGLYDSQGNFQSLQTLSDWYAENMPDYEVGLANEGYENDGFYTDVDEYEHLPLTIFIKKTLFLGD